MYAQQCVQPSRTNYLCGLTNYVSQACTSDWLSSLLVNSEGECSHSTLYNFATAVRVSPILGGYSAGAPPLPIPNRAVKPRSADGTAVWWESRSSPSPCRAPRCFRASGGSLCLPRWPFYSFPDRPEPISDVQREAIICTASPRIWRCTSASDPVPSTRRTRPGN